MIEKSIEKQLDIATGLNKLINNLGLKENITEILITISDFIIILLASVVIYYISKIIVKYIVHSLAKKTASKWDDIFISEKVFNSICMLIPALLVFNTIGITLDEYPKIAIFVDLVVKIYIVVLFAIIVNRTMRAAEKIYNNNERAKRRPIRGIMQVIRFLFYSLIVLVILSILFKQKPIHFLSFIGAGSAIMMLVFKDSILGFVGGIQLSLNDMVGIGDWISIPSKGVDGDVKEISLTTIKVVNFDNSILTVPTYFLVSDVFQNYRGMQESGVRRMKRSITIDISSVKFCSNEDLEKYKKISILKNYVENKQNEIEEYNKLLNVDVSSFVNGRKQTNIGVFRAYLTEFLKNHQGINENYTLMTRQLEPTQNGIPIEIYAFINTTIWVDYEVIQSNIFDHILAVVPYFDLKIFHAPSGEDFRNLIKD